MENTGRPLFVTGQIELPTLDESGDVESVHRLDTSSSLTLSGRGYAALALAAADRSDDEPEHDERHEHER